MGISDKEWERIKRENPDLIQRKGYPVAKRILIEKERQKNGRTTRG